MRKIVLLLGIAFCLASAETGYSVNVTQEEVCGGELLSFCISLYQKQCNDKNYATCLIAGALETERENYKDAKKYYEMACEKTNIKATYQSKIDDKRSLTISGADIVQKSCSALGSLYNFGEGVRQDYSKAMQYYKKSCDLGSGDGYLKLGLSYYGGNGVQKNIKLAINLLTKSCEAENAIACIMIGAMYRNGEDVKQSFSKAKELYGKACDLGYQLGCDAYRKLNEMNIK